MAPQFPATRRPKAARLGLLRAAERTPRDPMTAPESAQVLRLRFSGGPCEAGPPHKGDPAAV